MSGEEAFISKNIDTWSRLEDYNKKLKRIKISKLTRGELKEYTALFRTASHHLSYARTYYEGSGSIEYLNQILGASHSYFYLRRMSAFNELAGYFVSGFPGAFRKHFKFFLASAALFFIGAAFIIYLSYQDPSYIYYFLPPGMEEANNLSGSLPDDTWYFPVISSVIMINNIRVCILAAVYGLMLGAGTVYIVLLNSLSLGAIYAMVLLNGMNQARFWSLILPHGFIELTAIFISSAAGLCIGKSMLVPGDLSRAGSLVKGCKEAFYLMPGITVMLIAAGVIEGFFTPLNIPDVVKLGFSYITLALLTVYFLLSGRKRKRRAASNND